MPLQKMQKVASIAAHPEMVWQLAPHPNLPLLATASSDKSCRILSLQTLTALSTIDGGHKRSVRAVAWKPNTQGELVLATGSFDATAGIWRRSEPNQGVAAGGACDGNGSGEEDNSEEDDEWRFSVVLSGHESEIKSVAWSTGGTFLATCSRDKSVWVWEEMDDDNFEVVAVLQEHTQDVKHVAWHPEEALLASASYDDNVRLYREDVDEWVCCALLAAHTSTVWCVVFEPPAAPGYQAARSARLASCSDDLTVRVWTRTKRSDGATVGAVTSILRSDPVEEEWVCSAVLPKVHRRSIYSVSWSARTGRIVSCGGDGLVAVYEECGPGGEGENEGEGKGERAWKVVAMLRGAHGVHEVNCVAWSKRYDEGKRGDDDELVVSAGDDGEVNFWALVEQGTPAN